VRRGRGATSQKIRGLSSEEGGTKGMKEAKTTNPGKGKRGGGRKDAFNN